VVGHVDVDDATPIVGSHDETVERLASP
jgi:hypothetical protein